MTGFFQIKNISYDLYYEFFNIINFFKFQMQN